MGPSKEYLDHIAKRLEAMNPDVVNGGNIINQPYKMPSFEDQLGQTAMAYLANKKNQVQKYIRLFQQRRPNMIFLFLVLIVAIVLKELI
jgi:hypothetical protein